MSAYRLELHGLNFAPKRSLRVIDIFDTEDEAKARARAEAKRLKVTLGTWTQAEANAPRGVTGATAFSERGNTVGYFRIVKLSDLELLGSLAKENPAYKIVQWSLFEKEGKTVACVSSATDALLERLRLEKEENELRKSRTDPRTVYFFQVYEVDDLEYLASLGKNAKRNTSASPYKLTFEREEHYFPTREEALAFARKTATGLRTCLNWRKSAVRPGASYATAVGVVFWLYPVSELEYLASMAKSVKNPKTKRVPALRSRQLFEVYRLEYFHAASRVAENLGLFSSERAARYAAVAKTKKLNGRLSLKEKWYWAHWHENHAVGDQQTFRTLQSDIGTFRLVPPSGLEQLAQIGLKRKR